MDGPLCVNLLEDLIPDIVESTAVGQCDKSFHRGRTRLTLM